MNIKLDTFKKIPFLYYLIALGFTTFFLRKLPILNGLQFPVEFLTYAFIFAVILFFLNLLNLVPLKVKEIGGIIIFIYILILFLGIPTWYIKETYFSEKDKPTQVDDVNDKEGQNPKNKEGTTEKEKQPDIAEEKKTKDSTSLDDDPKKETPTIPPNIIENTDQNKKKGKQKVLVINEADYGIKVKYVLKNGIKEYPLNGVCILNSVYDNDKIVIIDTDDIEHPVKVKLKK